jgi:hypothetical protein
MIQRVCETRKFDPQEKTVSALLHNKSLSEKAVNKKIDDLARDRQRAQQKREDKKKKEKEAAEAEAKAQQDQQQSKTTKKSGDGDKGTKRLRVSEKHRQMAYARRIQLQRQ